MAKDALLKLRAAAAGNLTATGTGSWIDFKGPDLLPMTYQVDVPAFVAGSTLDVVIEDSLDGTNVFEKHTMKQIAAIGQFHTRAKFKGRYRRFNVTVAGAGANFGAVEICPVPGGRYESI